MTQNSNVQSILLQRQQESSVAIIRDKEGYVRPVNFSEAIGRNSKTLLDVQKGGGLKRLTGWVMGRLIELFTYLGAFGTVTEYQVQMLATRICAKFFYFTPAELDYFFLKFENGDYGTMYVGKTVNPQVIMSALLKYEMELQSAKEEEASRKKANEIARRNAEEKENAVSWEEYCRINGIEGKKNPLSSLGSIANKLKLE